jgi:hypothetical protein
MVENILSRKIIRQFYLHQPYYRFSLIFVFCNAS